MRCCRAHPTCRRARHAEPQTEEFAETADGVQAPAKLYWGRHLWARGYFVATSGNAMDEVIVEYVRQQDGTEPNHGGDIFQITKE
jgi:REP element-mobilizing transposase RayT